MFPLFAEAKLYDALSILFHANGLPFLVFITAILMGGILGVAKLVVRHRERMAMIERGMHPDCKEEEPPAADFSGESHESE